MTDVWRRILTRVINSCLNKYFEEVETNQVNNVSLLSYWGSGGLEVKVEKAKLKRDALVSLTSRTDFPLKINEGRLDTFEVQISDVKNAKAKILLNGLYILLEPVDVRNAASDPEKIKQIQSEAFERILALKEHILTELENQISNEVQTEAEGGYFASMADTFTVNILKNARVEVQNVHIRWEDQDLKFSTGMFFKSIELEQIPDKKVVDKNVIYRQAALKNFAYYWTPNLSTSILKSVGLSTSEKFAAMEASIEKRDEIFILQPTSVEMPIEVNWDYKTQLKKLLEKAFGDQESADQDFADNLNQILPLISANLNLKQITIDMHQSQFQNIMRVLSHMNSTRTYLKWSHLRPYKSKSWKGYWKFAIDAVLESGARDKAQLFSWNAIKAHLVKVRKYEALYLEFSKNSSKDLTFKKPEEVLSLERDLDTHNIAIVRRKVDYFLNKRKSAKVEDSQTWGSWGASWFSSTEPVTEIEKASSVQNTDKLSQQEMQEMIASLVPALTRQETGSKSANLEPDMYQKFRAKFMLENFIVNICDSNKKRVFQLEIKDTFVEHVKHASPYELITYQVKAIQINGINDSNLLCNASKLTRSNFIDFRYELFPLKCDYDSTISFKSKEPLCLIYNSESIKSLMRVFKLPEADDNDVETQRLKRKFEKQTNEVVSNAKQATKLGLKHLANTRVNCKIEIDIQSPIIVLPMDGKNIENNSTPTSAVLMNLGRLVVKMEPVPKNDNLSIGNIDYETELEHMAYDTFTVNLTDTKVNVAYINNLQNVLEISETDFCSTINPHVGSLIEPINIEIELKKYINDSQRPADMAKFLVNVSLKRLEVKAEEERLLTFISILKSITDGLIENDGGVLAENDSFESVDDVHVHDIYSRRLSAYEIDANMVQSLTNSNLSSKLGSKLGTKMDSKSGSNSRRDSEISNDSFHSATDQAEFWELLKLRFSVGHLKINLYAVNDELTETTTSSSFSTSTSHLLSLDISNFEISGHIEQQTRNESVTKQHFFIELEGLSLLHPNTGTHVIRTQHLEKLDKYAVIDYMKLSGIDGKETISAEFAGVIINVCPYILAKVLNFQSNLMNALDKELRLESEEDDNFTPRSNSSKKSKTSKLSKSGSKSSSKSSSKSKIEEINTNREIDIKVNEVAIELSYSEVESDEIMLLSLISATDFRLKIHQSYDNMYMKAELKGMEIQDHRRQSKGATICYNQNTQNKSFFSLQVNLPNIPSPEIFNTDQFSGEVKMEISGLIFVFFYDYLNKMLKWNDNLSAALAYNDTETQMLTNKISKMSLSQKKSSEMPSKYKLDIDIQAPKIVLPRSENSHGLYGLMVDLGRFKITNTLELAGEGKDSFSDSLRLLDSTKIIGSDIDFCRMEFEDTHSYKISRTFQSLVNKFTLELSVSRQIYPFDQPHYMEVKMYIPDVFIRLSADDIQEMMLVYKLNFSVTKEEDTTNQNKNLVKIDNIDSSDHAQSDFIVSVNVKKLGIEFMENENASVACFELENVVYNSASKVNRLTGMLEEENLKAVISEINLWDRRQGQAQKFIQPKEISKNMVEFTSKTPPSGNKIDDIKVHGFYMLLNISFLLEIYDVLGLALNRVEEDMKRLVVIEEPLGNIKISKSNHSRITMVKDQASSIQILERKSICKTLSWENSELILCDLTEKPLDSGEDFECLKVDFTMSGSYDVSNHSSDTNGKFELVEFGVSTARFSPMDFKVVKLAGVMSSTSFNLKFQQNEMANFLVGELYCPSVEVTVRPNMIETITKSINSIFRKTEDAELLKDAESERDFQFEDFWICKKIKLYYDESNLPDFLKLTTKDSLSLSSFDSVLDTGQQEFRVKIPKMLLNIETKKGQPLFMVKTNVNAIASKFYTPKAEYKMNKAKVDVKYFNNVENIWECFVEPVGGREFEFDVIYKTSDKMIKSSDALVSCEVVSNMDLNLSVSSTLLNVLTHSKSVFDVSERYDRSKAGRSANVSQSSGQHGSPTSPVSTKYKQQFMVENKTGVEVHITWPKKLNFQASIHDNHTLNSFNQDVFSYQRFVVLQKDQKCAFFLPTDQLSSYTEAKEDPDILVITTELSSSEKALNIDPRRPNKYGSDFQNIHAKVSNKHMKTTVLLRSNLSIKNEIVGTLVVANLEIKQDEEAFLPLNMIHVALESQENLSCAIQKKLYETSEEHETIGIFDFSMRETYEIANNASSLKQLTSPRNKTDQNFIRFQAKTSIIGQPNSNQTKFQTRQLSVMPAYEFYNWLPYQISISDDYKYSFVEPANSAKIFDGIMELVTFTVHGYNGADWVCRGVDMNSLEINKSDLLVMKFVKQTEMRSTGVNQEPLCLAFQINKNHHKINIFAPYWFVNRVEQTIHYEIPDSNVKTVIKHSVNDSIQLISIPKPELISKKTFGFIQMEKDRALFRSKKFCLDETYSSGSLVCYGPNNVKQEIGVSFQAGAYPSTKILTFNSYYQIRNETGMQLQIKEHNVGRGSNGSLVYHGGQGLYVAKKSVCPFWPNDVTKSSMVTIKIVGSKVDAVYSYEKEDTGSFLRLDNSNPSNQGIGFFVTTTAQDGVRTIKIMDYFEGCVPFKVFNLTRYPIALSQTKHDMQVIEVNSFSYISWFDVFESNRSLMVTINGIEYTETRKRINYYDAGKNYRTRNDDETIEAKLAWEGKQRIIIFKMKEVIDRCSSIDELEKLKTTRRSSEYKINLRRLNLSFIQTESLSAREIFHLCIEPHGDWMYFDLGKWIKFDEKYSNFLDMMKNKKPERMDNVEFYKTGNNTGYYVDLNRIIKKQIKIIRSDKFGLQIQTFTVADITQLGIKMNRLQIDDPSHNAKYPVFLYPVPPPPNILEKSRGMHPCLVINIATRETRAKHITFIESANITLTEIAVNLKLDYAMELASFVTGSMEYTVKQQQDYFKENDYEKAMNKDFREISDENLESNDSNSAVMFLSNFSITPMKINLTCQLGASEESNSFIDQMIKAVKSTIGDLATNMEDVPLTFSSFQLREHFTTSSLLNEKIMSSYKHQVLQQIYKILLGLDVIGNPYGALKGVKDGFEGLFYQPYQALGTNPEDLFTGLNIGIRGAAGGLIGGVTGIGSKMLGTGGKILTNFTFDDDFKEDRLKRVGSVKDKPFDTLGTGVIGTANAVSSGFTGIFSKPFEGARDDGAKGFFKGIGKGLLGAVTKPTSAVIDMVSTTTEAVHNKADVEYCDMNRVRFPRCVSNGNSSFGAYCLNDAIGMELMNKILDSFDDGVNHFYRAHVVVQRKSERNNNFLAQPVMNSSQGIDQVLMLTNQVIIHAAYDKLQNNFVYKWALVESEFLGVESALSSTGGQNGLTDSFSSNSSRISQKSSFQRGSSLQRNYSGLLNPEKQIKINYTDNQTGKYKKPTLSPRKPSTERNVGQVKQRRISVQIEDTQENLERFVERVNEWKINSKKVTEEFSFM